MGEVYRARDLTLRRDVAVKVLLDEFATDHDRLKRFEREAMATAALNHPNILAMHDVGTHDGVTYIVSELLEGRSLDALLADGPLPLRKAMRFASQIADGLGAAHAKGIVHRDVKPANVFVTGDDRIKILDFGLARMVAGSPLGGGLGATTTTALTTAGTVLGSAGYMAPEQVRGHDVDHRADIFSFGAVLYEMLTGHGFRRDPWLAARGLVEPATLVEGDGSAAALHAMRLVRRCLEKSPNDRFIGPRSVAGVARRRGQPRARRGRRRGGWWPRASLAPRSVLQSGPSYHGPRFRPPPPTVTFELSPRGGSWVTRRSQPSRMTAPRWHSWPRGRARARCSCAACRTWRHVSCQARPVRRNPSSHPMAPASHSSPTAC